MLKNLDSDDRENLDSDPVELIKAAPSASLGETHEDIAARLVVHLLAAVEHVDHDADRPPEVLRRLGLPSSSWALGCAPHHQVQGLREGDVAPGQVDEKLQSAVSHLSVSGVMTRRGVFPRYSWLYRNCASQMFAKQSSSTLSHLHVQ